MLKPFRYPLLSALLVLFLVPGAFAKPPYVSIGYLQDTSTMSFSQIQWNNLTHIYEAFAEPISGGNGTVNVPYGPRGGLLASCHLNSTRCIISFGGQGSPSSDWRNDISPANQANFINNIMNLVTTGDGAGNSYDGVDIDWEFPSGSDQTNFMSFMSNLYSALHATSAYDGQPRQLSFYTIGGYAICGVNWATAGTFTDYCMCGGYSYGCDAYNGPLTDLGCAGNFDCVGGVARRYDVSDSVTRLANLGYPLGKIVLGFPLYGGSGPSDDSIFASGTFNSYDTPQDEANYTYGGGTIYVDTAQSFCDKMNWAFKQSPPLPGIFLWDISFAKTNEAPVTAIWQVISGTAPCLTIPPTNTPTSTYTPTITYTPTNTLTPTLTPTPCFNSLGTPCATNTPTASFLNIPSAIVFPNPSDGRVTPQLAIPLTSPEDVEVKIYTVALRKIGDQIFPQVAPGSPIPLAFSDSWGNGLSNGVYYLVISSPEGSFTVKWLILR